MYYTDRDYTLTSVLGPYVGMEAIITPNNDYNRTDASDYLTFTMPYDGMVYIAFDSRATSLPDWASGFVDTGDSLLTSTSDPACVENIQSLCLRWRMHQPGCQQGTWLRRRNGQ